MQRQGEELEQLLLALMGANYRIAELDLGSLLAAADDNLDWLLARLRQLLQEGWRFDYCSSLEASVRQMHWVRPRPR